MRIVSVEAIVLKVAPEEAYLGPLRDGTAIGSAYTVRKPWRSLYSARYETLLVKVAAADGSVGWGEALAPVGPEVPAAVVDHLIAPVLLGMDPTSPRASTSRLRGLMRERGHLVGHQADALAAVDIALWDLAGRILGVSTTTLLGGALRTSIPTYVSGLPRPTDDARVALARKWEQRGAMAVKLHLGYGLEADLATVDRIRSSTPSLRVAVDAHWAYDVSTATRMAAYLAEQGVWFLEAPLEPEDVTGHAELVARSPIPIAVGESLRNRYEFCHWLNSRSLHIAQPDVGRTGITEAMTIAALCEARHIPIAPHHSVGLGIALAAGLQVAASAETVSAFEYQPSSTVVGAQILETPPEHDAASFMLPSGPGLGVDVDEDAVRKLAEQS